MGSRRRPVRVDSGQTPSPPGLMPACPGRDKPGASRARCDGRGGGSARVTAGGRVPGDEMGSREARLANPGTFPAVAGIWRLPAGGERRCAVCNLLARDVDFQGVATGDKQRCNPGWAVDMSGPCSPAHPGRGFREVKHTGGPAELPVRTPSSCP